MRTKNFTFKKTTYVKQETEHKAISLDLTGDEARVLVDILGSARIHASDANSPEDLFLGAIHRHLRDFLMTSGTTRQRFNHRLNVQTYSVSRFHNTKNEPFSNGDQTVTGTVGTVGGSK